MSTISTLDINAIVSAIEGAVALATAIIAAVQTVLKNIATKKAETATAEAEAATAAAEQAQAETKALDDLMNPYVEQTAEQTALITNGTVSDDAWKMSIGNIEELSKQLQAAGGLASIDVVRATVKQAEKENQVEYAILCTPAEKGKQLDDYPAAFISYGTIAKVADWATIKAIAQEHKCGDWYSIAG